jgi:hypothetical protein
MTIAPRLGGVDSRGYHGEGDKLTSSKSPILAVGIANRPLAGVRTGKDRDLAATIIFAGNFRRMLISHSLRIFDDPTAGVDFNFDII